MEQRIIRADRQIIQSKIEKWKSLGKLAYVVKGLDGVANRWRVVLHNGVDITYDTYKKGKGDKDVYPKCIGEVFNGFVACKQRLGNYKKIEDCNQGVNFGDFSRLHEKGLIKIDINRCYFNVAHILGFISDELYKKYENKKFKKSCNIAIGKCATSTTITYYDENGNKTDYIIQKNELEPIRANILDYVARLYDEVSKEVDIVIFNTDCFSIEKQDEATDKENIEKIMRIIDKHRLTYKLE